VDVPFGTFNGNLRDPIVKNYAFTVGTFNPMGTVLIHATDDSGQTQTAFALHDTNGHYIPLDISYVDCISTTPHTLTTTDLSLTALQSSMVITSGYPNGSAPCHPYSGATIGNGAGQLSFTIPALTSGSYVAGTYTDTVTLTVTAN
jgi:hypothetical protein